MKYLSKLLPTTAEECELLDRLTPVKTEWTWNMTYQNLLDEVKALIREDACMKFYDETRPP